ncbi:YciI family protein [Dyella tabacisoli]|uniref:YCII-related domain-containing protein n=1 Tax=Dyella tabacisoli TaxID=2282381 RepID=A0A369UT56_9GAMM|nr:YciI family protein [Dyella tabacisoli]RDD83657.1 hypothetical protein DVJ77_03535 [Dyella tabacisoli]
MNRYLILVMRRPQFDPAMVRPHQDFLEGLRAGGRIELSGPFGDKTGGAYLLHADSFEEALAIVHTDPAYISGGWEMTVYEWHAR